MLCLKHHSFQGRQGLPFCSKHTRSLADTLRVQADLAEEYFTVTQMKYRRNVSVAVLCEDM